MIRGTAADGKQEVVLRSGVSVWIQILEWWSAHRAEVAQMMVRLDIDRRWVDTQAMFGERLADALDPSSRTVRPACGGGHPLLLHGRRLRGQAHSQVTNPRR
jgi:hypothetical protein